MPAHACRHPLFPPPPSVVPRIILQWQFEDADVDWCSKPIRYSYVRDTRKTFAVIRRRCLAYTRTFPSLLPPLFANFVDNAYCVIISRDLPLAFLGAFFFFGPYNLMGKPRGEFVSGGNEAREGQKARRQAEKNLS